MASNQAAHANKLGLLGRARTAVQHVSTAFAVRHERAALHAMPDRMLKDIGVSRSQIDYYVDTGYR